MIVSENGAAATKNYVSFDREHSFQAAASKVATRSGRHFAQFTRVSEDYLFFGVIRPGWDVEEGSDVEDCGGHCFYATGSGHRFPGEHAWEGRQGAEQGDRIGMLLDLDQGSMSIEGRWETGGDGD